MKKTLFVSISLSLLLVSITSCVKNWCNKPKLPYQKLTDSIKVWLPYNANRDIVFENNNLQTDTIHLKDYFAGDDEIWQGDECPPGIGQFIRCSFYSSATNDTINAEIGYKFIFQVSRKSGVSWYSDDTKFVSFTNSNGKYEDFILLNGKTFFNCIWADCTGSNNCDQFGITRYYFAKHKGLVSYIKDSVLWTAK